MAKDSLRESSSEYAQGGIAVALSDDDEVDLHEQDTLAAGAGLCNREAVRMLVEEGPAGIEQLIDWGAEFDRDGSKLLFAHEGAHSRRRVLHSHGDSTGREIARTLYKKASSLPNVSFQSFAAVTDLLIDGDTVCGAVACDAKDKRPVAIHARAVLLATGGLGRVFKETTNPDVASGDGVAAAYRAGAVISDIEFVQFHPTALFIEGAPRFLLSEALRGEGAYLRNARGDRFMDLYHPMSELAPRDVVAKSIVQEMQRTGTPVYLDLSHREPGFVKRRFPRIYETCLAFGIDLEKQRAPVHPAAHYSMGGVRTDLDGQTNVAGLFAAGEVACTGVHGANRLASNSLLEGVVFGARAGVAMREWVGKTAANGAIPEQVVHPKISEAEVRQIAWDYCGVARSGDGLSRALQRLLNVEQQPGKPSGRNEHELRNIHAIARLIAKCAIARQESRGSHYRVDFPETSPEFQRHSNVSRTSEVFFA